MEAIGDLPSDESLPILTFGDDGPSFNLLAQFEKRTYMADMYFINQKGLATKFPRLVAQVMKRI